MTDMDFIKCISHRISEILRFNSLAPKDISSISGISITQIYRILSGNCDSSIRTLHKLLSCLNISLYSFFNFSLPINNLSDINSTYSLSEELKSVAENLRIQQNKMLRINGLTQEKIAEELGYTDYRYVNYILNGRHNTYINIKISTLYKLSKLLGLENNIHTLFNFNLGGN